MLIVSKYSKYSLLFGIIPTIYPLFFFKVIMNLYEEEAQNFASIGFLLEAMNTLFLHLSLVYILLFGDMKRRMESYHREKNYFSFFILLNMACFISFSIYSYFHPVPGFSLVYLFWSVDLLLFGEVNRLLGEVMSSKKRCHGAVNKRISFDNSQLNYAQKNNSFSEAIDINMISSKV
jgi:hypothetical protein